MSTMFEIYNSKVNKSDNKVQKVQRSREVYRKAYSIKVEDNELNLFFSYFLFIYFLILDLELEYSVTLVMEQSHMSQLQLYNHIIYRKISKVLKQ